MSNGVYVKNKKFAMQKQFNNNLRLNFEKIRSS